MKQLFLLLLSISYFAIVSADIPVFTPVQSLSLPTQTDQGVSQTDTIATDGSNRRTLLGQWWESLVHGNIDRTFERPIDFTFAAAPYYSQESSVGIGVTGSALYRIDRTDTLTQVSDFSIMAGASVTGNTAIGSSGNINFDPDNRISFKLLFKHQERDFWGITFGDCARNHKNDNAGKIRNQCDRVITNIDYMHGVYRNWFVGAAFRFNYTKMAIGDEELERVYLRQLSPGGFYTGVGALIQYDSRDFILNPKRGLYFLVREIYYPHLIGKNECDVFNTTIQFNAYHRLWRGATLCYDFIAELNNSEGVVPWPLRNEICTDDRRMRGYYTSSYIDNNQICAQVELRQHLWSRLGAVAWVGAGTLYRDFKDIKHQTLGNYGVGIRFELKHNTNIRLDVGCGKDTRAFVFSFAEAF